MATRNVTIRVPFDFCKKCDEYEVDENDFYAGDELDHRDLFCANYYICENACNLLAVELRNKTVKKTKTVSMEERKHEGSDKH